MLDLTDNINHLVESTMADWEKVEREHGRPFSSDNQWPVVASSPSPLVQQVLVQDTSPRDESSQQQRRHEDLGSIDIGDEMIPTLALPDITDLEQDFQEMFMLWDFSLFIYEDAYI